MQRYNVDGNAMWHEFQLIFSFKHRVPENEPYAWNTMVTGFPVSGVYYHGLCYIF